MGRKSKLGKNEDKNKVKRRSQRTERKQLPPMGDSWVCPTPEAGRWVPWRETWVPGAVGGGAAPPGQLLEEQTACPVDPQGAGFHPEEMPLLSVWPPSTPSCPHAAQCPDHMSISCLGLHPCCAPSLACPQPCAGHPSHRLSFPHLHSDSWARERTAPPSLVPGPA